MSLPPPGQMPPDPTPYGYTPYGAMTSREHPNGTTVLVLGILSLVVCGLLGPIAWGMGNSALKEMNAQPSYDWRNRGNITAGRICGIISTMLLVVSLLGIAVLIAAR